MEPCKICNSQDWAVGYEGPIRSGTFGKTVSGTVYQCSKCGVQFLPTVIKDLEAYYRDGTYRDNVNESSDIETYFKLHDAEQLKKYAVLEAVPLRGKILADVGCGGGSFLDGVRGFASQTIGIEPTAAYHDSLKTRGHRVYTDVDSAMSEWCGRVNVVTTFSVIEHVKDPVAFLRSIKGLLAEDGVVLVSTPNLRDFLMSKGVKAYQSFFYRTAHIHYFDQDSLKTAACEAGFPDFVPKHVHRFNFANFMGWLQENKPTGGKQQTALGASFDSIWQSNLEARGISDYLYAFLRR